MSAPVIPEADGSKAVRNPQSAPPQAGYRIRHCEPKAKQSSNVRSLDCLVALLLAMTMDKQSSRR
jgi:hypothetical protein